MLRKACTKDPAGRYAHCAEMVPALRAHLASLRTGERTVLADPEAGRTKLALVTMTPPASKTLTIIGQSLLRSPGASEPAAVGRSRDARKLDTRGPSSAAEAHIAASRRPAWLLPTLLGVGGTLLLGAVLAVILFGRGGDAAPVAASGRTLEADAAVFYEARLEDANAGRHADVVKAVDESAGRFDRTTYSLRIAKLRESSAAKVAEAARKAEEERRAREAEDTRERAALEDALAAVARAEGSGDLAGAARGLKDALAIRDDDGLRSRLARIERALAAEKLVADGEAALAAGALASAGEAFDAARPDALGATKLRAEAGIAEVKRRLAAEAALAAIQARLDAKDWPGAWKAVGEARAAGIDDPKLVECAKAAAKELAPKPAIAGRLGVELVLVPGGTFRMGSDTGRTDERPVHEVTVSAFYVGRFEVTRVQLGAFRRKLKVAPASSTPREREPAVEVGWDEASEFCRYLSALDPEKATYRLPTEAEWEFAARGASGRIYPWGNDPPGPKHANLLGSDDGFDAFAPVGSFRDGATPEGAGHEPVLDMVGNAAEWCADWYGPYPAGAARDPAGPETGTHRAVRGGAHAYDAATWSRSSARARGLPDSRKDTVGFRVARELTAGECEYRRAAGDD
jgi:formylglycine-generating enzyme required for sulfatase activity